MSHDHSHCSRTSTENVKLAFFLNLLFTLIEFVGGLWCNSMAVLADAIHDLGDTIALGFSWYMERISDRKRDGNFSYGYRRFSLLSALVNCIVLISGSILVLIEAIPRILRPESVNVPGVFLLSILGILFNGVAFWRLKRGETLNEKLVTWHLLEDVLGWTMILVMTITMHFFDVPILDPIFSILFSLFILFNVLKNLRTTLAVFLQSIPTNIDLTEIESDLRKMEGVQDLHDLHVWSMDGAYHVFTLHVVIGNEFPQENIPGLKTKVKNYLIDKNVQHVTLEMEREGDHCELKNC